MQTQAEPYQNGKDEVDSIAQCALPKSRQWQTIQRIESHTLVCMKVSGLGHYGVSITLTPHR
jgi:hypothetical protein